MRALSIGHRRQKIAVPCHWSNSTIIGQVGHSLFGNSVGLIRYHSLLVNCHRNTAATPVERSGFTLPSAGNIVQEERRYPFETPPFEFPDPPFGLPRPPFGFPDSRRDQFPTALRDGAFGGPSTLHNWSRSEEVTNPRSAGQNNAKHLGARAIPINAKVAKPRSVSWALAASKAMGIDPFRPIFIGGATDGYVPGRRLVKDYAAHRKGGGNFFDHINNRGPYEAVEAAYALGAPVIIVGHSWGAYSALNVAKYAVDRGIPIDLLVTVDPVDGPFGIFNSVTSKNIMQLKKDLPGAWVNIRAARHETHPAEESWGDLAARMGKRFKAQSKADVPLTLDVHHEDFPEMMKAANIERMISTVYYNYKLRKMK
jgi:hypothetical protein